MRHCGGGSAEFAADVDAISGASAGAEDGAAFGDGAEDDDVGEDSVGGFGGVAAGERGAMFLGERDQAASEASDPGLGKAARQGKREKDGDGISAHGGDVAEAAGEAAMADRFGGMPVAAEVDAFEGEVGSDQRVQVRRQAKHGAVVSDGLGNSGVVAAPCGREADASD